jgi:hypothetical protein
VTTIETRLKALIGDLVFQVAALQVEVDKLKQELATATKESTAAGTAPSEVGRVTA